MNNEEKRELGKKNVLSLLSKKEFLSTKAIREKGIAQGMYKNWSTYSRFLEILETEKKVEKIEAAGSILWRKK